MGIIVQKFGGTSLKDSDSQEFLLSHIIKAKEEGNGLVIVVSAMGRMGDPYATDTLINQLEKINSHIKPKNKDLIMFCGEIISSAIVSHLLDTSGIDSEALTGFQAGIITDNNFTSSNILNIDTSRILEYIKKGKIVVVTGFQGITENMEITTLGRGGSDITAVNLGGYLKAKRVDIFTDVPGVSIIDPKLIPDSKYINNISYSNMFKLASAGVGVIHPKAVLAGNKFNIPIYIRSTFLQEPGTIISQEDNNDPNKIIGIAIKDNKKLTTITIVFNEVGVENIRKLINPFLYSNINIEIKVLWLDGMVTVTMDTGNILSFVKDLYNHLDSNALI